MWGTRGSLPRAMNNNSIIELIEFLITQAKTQNITQVDEFLEALKDGDKIPFQFLGGQTTCWEVSQHDQHVFIDMGTGITDACFEAMRQGRNEFDICMTHMHWDHIIGLNFFIPIYNTGTKIRIHHVHQHTPEYIKILFNGVNFPLKWDELGAEVEFVHHKLYDKFKIGDIQISPFALDHPGGSFGYRFEAGGKSCVIGIDGEYKRITPKELGKDLAYYQKLDLLVFDAQYEMNELASRFDWGHSSPPIGVDLALREGIKNLALAHHDPRGTESRAQRMLEQAKRHCKSQLTAYSDVWEKSGQPEGPNIMLGYDGMMIDLDKL